ncbi:MAG: FAD:protein FMN transferase [Gammaproteobacteria bacterium]|nr:FAD:protein FMN transferase [Gammaproteobacteria bacterium]
MGTRYKVHIHRAPDGFYLPKLKQHIEQVFATTESLMSTYRSDSELSLFNASTSTDWQLISTDTARIVETALKVQEQSGSAFNPATGSLVDYWGFGARPKPIPEVFMPPPPQILDSVKNANIELESGRLRKSHSQATLDLNAIAKGDAIDGVAAVLERNQISNYLIEIGGEIYARGSGPEGAGWRVGLEDPATDILATIQLDEKALATSGDYVNYFMQNGIRYSHVIDPRVGRPIDHHIALVSVVAGSAMQADAWATALLVMGLEQGFRHALQHAMAALFLQRDGEEYRPFLTPAFEQLV